MKRELTCIVCPKGCAITITSTKDGLVCTGQGCSKGEAYALQETTAPKRMLTATVEIRGAVHARCPVVSSEPVPKERMLEILEVLKPLVLNAPVRLNQVIVPNILDTGIDILASRTLEKDKI